MLVDVTYGGVGLRIDAVARQLHRLPLIVIHQQIVGVRGEFQHVGGQPVIVTAALLGRDWSMSAISQMPFADVGGVIIRLFEIMRQCEAIAGQRDAIAVAAGFGGVEARLQAGARRTADWLTGDGIVDIGAGAGEAIEVETEVERVAVDARRIPALLIGEEDNHIRPLRRHARSPRT